MSSIKIANESHWHELRKRCVGASESPALFGMLPWLTTWQLHMQKTGKLPAPDLDSVKHIKQGKHFEPAIAAWAMEKWGIQLNKVRRYLIADDCPGMGASLDYEQIGTGERIPTEIKWVVGRSDHWEYDGDEIQVAPDYYLVQVQHQLGCSEDEHGQLIAFIDGDLRRAIYPRREKMIESIKASVRRFWFDIEQGNEPPIDFKADAESVMRYASFMPMRQIEWSPTVSRYTRIADRMDNIAKRAAAKAKANKARLTNLMIDRSAKELGVNDPTTKIECKGQIGGKLHKITNYYVGPYEGKEITDDMVGEHIGAREAYRVCLITTPKPKPEKKAARKRKPANDGTEDEHTNTHAGAIEIVRERA